MRRQADTQRFPSFAARLQSAFFMTAAILMAMSRARAQGQQETAAPLSRKEDAQPVRRIVVSIDDRKLALLEDGRVVKIYRVAVGAPGSPSPSGQFKIVHRIPNPNYYAPGVVLPPGPENPLGTRWIGLDLKGFGIHGTNQPGSIGRNASHGCIRMRNSDAEDLFERVRAGDSVELIAEHTETTARLFGGPHPEGPNPHGIKPGLAPGVLDAKASSGATPAPASGTE
jgi:lipoprotein-anchoring transpeptidase ErfK/SrfK